jgi:hypothetical protein
MGWEGVGRGWQGWEGVGRGRGREGLKASESFFGSRRARRARRARTR